MMHKNHAHLALATSVFVMMALFICYPQLAAATESSGTAWDTPLTTLRAAITGPIAYTISILGIVVAGGMLTFGGELNEFARRMIMLILVIALVMLAIQFLGTLWGVSGAEITPPGATTPGAFH